MQREKVNIRRHAINECNSTYYLRKELIGQLKKEVKVKKGTWVSNIILEY